MINKTSRNKSVLIVSNCTWYLYNFRYKLLNDLNNKGFNLILISPLDDYYFDISARYHSYAAFLEDITVSGLAIGAGISYDFL